MGKWIALGLITVAAMVAAGYFIILRTAEPAKMFATPMVPTPATAPTTARPRMIRPTTRPRVNIINGELTRVDKDSIAVLPLNVGGIYVAGGVNGAARNFALDGHTRFGRMVLSGERKTALGKTVHDLRFNGPATFADLKVGQKLMVIPTEDGRTATFVAIMPDAPATTQPNQ